MSLTCSSLSEKVILTSAAVRGQLQKEDRLIDQCVTKAELYNVVKYDVCRQSIEVRAKPDILTSSLIEKGIMEGSREEQDALQVGICQSSSRTAASREMKLGQLRGDACFRLYQPLCTACREQQPTQILSPLMVMAF